MLRMAGHWGPWLAEYTKAPAPEQRQHYGMLRFKFYDLLYGLNPDWANRQGL